jgi:hypothetical protein
MNVVTRMTFTCNSMRSEVRMGSGRRRIARSVRTLIGIEER